MTSGNHLGEPPSYVSPRHASRLVIRQVLRTLGKLSVTFCSTTLVLLAVAHVDPTLPHLRPDWHIFVSNEIRKSLGHYTSDKKSAGKFREGWGVVIEIVRADFMARQAVDSMEPLYLEAKNAFSNTKAAWDNEKCELVRQRDELKEELARAQELAALAEEREETIQLGEICSHMEISPKNMGEATQLKLELEAKEEELRKLQEADRKIRQCLKTAKRKGKELEGELKKILARVLVKPESKIMELLKSGKK
ncbi:hypothetical protein R1sor_014453 [Riccia sorocarpa]|uniref:Uncharacterized protein n=1 Tax=Riccia sorocarpa TaxID=122646 RepID=A0ABD3HFJ4_9MARC